MTYQESPNLTVTQKQTIYGTILGGSSLIFPSKGRSCYLAMRDSDLNWLKYKVEILKNCFKIDSNTIKIDKNTYRCFSIAYPIFNDIHQLFYKDGFKIISRDILESLTDEAWMVWFVDAGKKTKNKITFRTHKFREEGTRIIADYFNSLDCFCEVNLEKNCEIVFTNKGSHEFLSFAAPKFPKFLIEKYSK